MDLTFLERAFLKAAQGFLERNPDLVEKLLAKVIDAAAARFTKWLEELIAGIPAAK